MAGGKGPHQNIGGDSSFTTTSLATMGDKGSTKLKPTAPENRTHWKAGTSVEVAWGIRYNHGGGYQYRLCPANQPLTEDCMQKMPLEFDLKEGTSLVWNNGSRYKIENVFVSEGTWPKGSTWARNPIPRVNDDNIGQHDPDACKGPLKHYTPGCIQFPPVCPQDTGRMPWSTDGSGQGACSGDWTAGLIADRVIIPKTLPPGDYVLGWRWDCTHTCTCITPLHRLRMRKPVLTMARLAPRCRRGDGANLGQLRGRHCHRGGRRLKEPMRGLPLRRVWV
eukprot:COSAG06_NODE_1835_length_8257_cov_14.244300_4_plen_278_part_00